MESLQAKNLVRTAGDKHQNPPSPSHDRVRIKIMLADKLENLESNRMQGLQTRSLHERCKAWIEYLHHLQRELETRYDLQSVIQCIISTKVIFIFVILEETHVKLTAIQDGIILKKPKAQFCCQSDSRQ